MSSFKNKAPDKDKNATAKAAEVLGMTEPKRSVIEPAAASPEPTTKAGTASCIGSGLG